MKFNLGRAGYATDGQVDYIHTLIAALLEEGEVVNMDDDDIDELSLEEASELIDDLKDMLGWN